MLKHKNVNAKKIPKEAIEHMKKNTDMDIVYSCLCSLCRSIGALPPEKRIIKNNAKSDNNHKNLSACGFVVQLIIAPD